LYYFSYYIIFSLYSVYVYLVYILYAVITKFVQNKKEEKFIYQMAGCQERPKPILLAIRDKQY